MSTVVKPFPYSADGFTVEVLVAGQCRDFGALEAGLVAAGLVSVGGEAPKAEPKLEPKEPAPVAPVADDRGEQAEPEPDKPKARAARK